jgi:hypothetical protein
MEGIKWQWDSPSVTYTVVGQLHYRPIYMGLSHSADLLPWDSLGIQEIWWG